MYMYVYLFIHTYQRARHLRCGGGRRTLIGSGLCIVAPRKDAVMPCFGPGNYYLEYLRRHR